MAGANTSAFRLYILRHARSGWALPGQTDFDRTLDDVGFGEAEIIAEIAADRGLKPDLVISSTAMRCRQTAEAVRRAISEQLEITYVDSLYTGPASVYRDLIASQSDVASVMIIGHNPMIEEVLHECVGEAATSEAIPDGYPTAGLAVIDFAQMPDGTMLAMGKLIELLTPHR